MNGIGEDGSKTLKRGLLRKKSFAFSSMSNEGGGGGQKQLGKSFGKGIFFPGLLSIFATGKEENPSFPSRSPNLNRCQSLLFLLLSKISFEMCLQKEEFKLIRQTRQTSE